MAFSARSSSATYDEVAYLRIASNWWRTGSEDEITRMGSPLTFWKIQQAPVFWLLDRAGRGALIDDSIRKQSELLPIVRIGSLWIWIVALGLTSWWSRIRYGPRAMAFSAWLFALSPNLLAHGALITMEMPLVVTTLATIFLFVRFLETVKLRNFMASAASCGLAFSCKFTAVLIPVLLGIVWGVDCLRIPIPEKFSLFRLCKKVTSGMALYAATMVLADVLVTGGAVLTLSHEPGDSHPSLEGKFAPTAFTGKLAKWAIETPIPQDWVGFATQIRHQSAGGPSYLLGQRRMKGWWYYYFVAIGVKVPLSLWLLVVSSCVKRYQTARKTGKDPVKALYSRSTTDRDWIFPVTIALFLLITALGSSRNYGIRYLLPLAPLSIIWVSRLAEGGTWWRRMAIAGLVGQGIAVASVYPHELTYFNVLCGGRTGGRQILADSNLDWGQGLKGLARLQRERPEIRDLTLYYFGDTLPEYYGVTGVSHTIDAGEVQPDLPVRFDPSTEFVAVSASLQFGPWGPPGYFRRLEGLIPCAVTDDTTIAVYRRSDLKEGLSQ